LRGIGLRRHWLSPGEVRKILERAAKGKSVGQPGAEGTDSRKGDS
jgi:hypothetical protein